ncbi:hypothetical protein ACTFIW_005481 [Dictyostelium discoideum]
MLGTNYNEIKKLAISKRRAHRSFHVTKTLDLALVRPLTFFEITSKFFNSVFITSELGGGEDSAKCTCNNRLKTLHIEPKIGELDKLGIFEVEIFQALKKWTIPALIPSYIGAYFLSYEEMAKMLLQIISSQMDISDAAMIRILTFLVFSRIINQPDLLQFIFEKYITNPLFTEVMVKKLQLNSDEL